MKLSRILGVALVLVIFCFSAAATAAEPLRFAYQNRIGDALSIIAVNKKLFNVEGVQVKPLLFNNGPACSEALFTGAVDVATMGDTTAVTTVSRLPELRIIGSHGSGESRHRIIVAAHSNLRQLADLKGKRVGVKKGTSTHGGFLALLGAKGIRPTELKLIELDPATMPDALAVGSLDAFIASEPTPSLAEQRGGRELATLAGLGNNYPLLLLAKNTTLQKREADLRHFFKALSKAEQFIRSNPAEAVAILSKETGLTPAMTRRAMQRHSYQLQLDAATLESLNKTALFLKEQNKISKLPDFSRSMTRHFLISP
jgi:ABC-type nitrate/sulfonate/bicarbonate transport system substrate-binding protein